MRKVFKYDLNMVGMPSEHGRTINGPGLQEPHFVGIQDGRIVCWAVTDNRAADRSIDLLLIWTGEPLPDDQRNNPWQIVGTVGFQTADTNFVLVYHLFWRPHLDD